MPAEVLILGGGPAGCAAARLLARWGHDVVLRARPPGQRPDLGESLPPSTGKLFDALGVRDAVDRAGFVRAAGNTVWWGAGEQRVEMFDRGARGWQVTAAGLQQVLLGSAIEAGARHEQRRVSADDLGSRLARFTLDCTGRAGVLARARRLRRPARGPRTVALVGRWRSQRAFELPDPTHTLIESYADGWAWSVPDASGNRFVAVMVDPRSSRLARGCPPRAMYEMELAKTRALGALVRKATLIDGPAGWHASPYGARRYADDDALLVGDAASFVDPLSSAGVKKALASGWLAAIAVHTALTRPSMKDAAFGFFAAREAEMYSALQQLAARYLAEPTSGHPHPFWSDRADLAAFVEQERASALSGTAIEQAYERIRRAPSLALVQAPDVRVERRPAVSGREIVLEPRLCSSAHPEGIRYAWDADLLSLVELASTSEQVADLFDAYNRRSPPVALPDFLAALATAVACGFLRWKE